MKTPKFRESVNFKIDSESRHMIETLSQEERISIGEACRNLILVGAKVRGLI
jgi:hypothetical protein